MSLEQQYYLLLSRTDHPVFRRDFSEVTTADSPLNSIMNRVIAKQLVKLRAVQDEVDANAHPQSITALGIDQWEDTHFGFNKFSKTLQQRKDELLIKLNRRFHMSVPDVIALAVAITGLTPIVIRSLAYSGWILDESILDVDTYLPGVGNSGDIHTYLVIFSETVDSALLLQLDKELTRIEKGGSIHIISSPERYWLLDESALGEDTLLG